MQMRLWGPYNATAEFTALKRSHLNPSPGVPVPNMPVIRFERTDRDRRAIRERPTPAHIAAAQEIASKVMAIAVSRPEMLTHVDQFVTLLVPSPNTCISS